MPVVRDLREKRMMKALLYWWDEAHHELAREALRKAGRADLIGHGANCLVPPEWGGPRQPRVEASRPGARDPRDSKGGRRPHAARGRRVR